LKTGSWSAWWPAKAFSNQCGWINARMEQDPAKQVKVQISS